MSAIRKSGGYVIYDWQMKNGMLSQNVKPSGPKWIVDRLGVEYFGNPIFVWCGSGFTDRELVQVASLTRLQRLDVQRTSVSDAGLPHLKNLQRLQWLNLSYTRVTDAGLVHLKGLTNLEVLDLRHTRISKPLESNL